MNAKKLYTRMRQRKVETFFGNRTFPTVHIPKELVVQPPPAVKQFPGLLELVFEGEWIEGETRHSMSGGSFWGYDEDTEHPGRPAATRITFDVKRGADGRLEGESIVIWSEPVHRFRRLMETQAGPEEDLQETMKSFPTRKFDHPEMLPSIVAMARWARLDWAEVVHPTLAEKLCNAANYSKCADLALWNTDGGVTIQFRTKTGYPYRMRKVAASLRRAARWAKRNGTPLKVRVL